MANDWVGWMICLEKLEWSKTHASGIYLIIVYIIINVIYALQY